MIRKLPEDRLDALNEMIDKFNDIAVGMLRKEPLTSETFNEVGTALLYALTHFLKCEYDIRMENSTPEKVKQIIENRTALFKIVLENEFKTL